MHSKTLAGVAAWAAFNSSSLIHGETSQTVFAASKYWTATKSRRDRWARALRMFEQDVRATDSSHNPWPAIEVVVQEILVSEIMTRVWAAIMVSHDQQLDSDEMSAVAQTTHIGQIESRNRALRLIMAAQSRDPEWFDRMNTLRRKIERWTDMLLGFLPNKQVAAEFGFEKNRVKDFSNERNITSASEIRQQQSLIVAALLRDLQQSCERYPANPSFNEEIAMGVMGCFSADRFDSLGLPKSARQLWIEKHSYDSQMLVDHLSEMDSEVEYQATRF